MRSRAYSSDGKLAPFIAIKASRQRDTQLIRTFPYWPVLLSVAPDGTIWTTGEEMTSDRKLSGDGVNPNGDVVRHFDRSGKLIGSAIPRQTVSPPFRDSHGYLVAKSDRIGWYSPVQGNGIYVELSPVRPKGYRVYAGLLGEKGQANGFALTDSGEVFVTRHTPQKQGTYTLGPGLKPVD